jgi:hypothetical protein
LSTTLLTGMTGISLHIQWPLTTQSHSSFLQEKNLFFNTDQTPQPMIFLMSKNWQIWLKMQQLRQKMWAWPRFSRQSPFCAEN